MSAARNFPPALFPLGAIYATPGAFTALGRAGLTPWALLTRHRSGDWGEICEEDRGLNEWSISNGERIFSVYQLPTGERVWVITEADRASTMLLLPCEY